MSVVTPNRVRTAARRILMVAASPAVHPTLGYPVGAWASEITHPWLAFTEAGFDVRLASPDGGALVLDGYSDPRDPSGYSAHDLISLGFLTSPAHAALLQDTARLADESPEGYDALVITGGQSPMFTFRGHAGLQALIRGFWDAEKVVAALCHGVSALLDVTLADGSWLVAGRTMTGFANIEEDFANAAMGTTVMPWRIEDAARERGANFVQAGLFRPFAIRDGRLVTGQQNFSGGETARVVLEALGR